MSQEDTPLIEEGASKKNLVEKPKATLAQVHRSPSHDSFANFDAARIGMESGYEEQSFLRKKVWPRFTYYIPIVRWISEYKVKDYLLYDIIAGLSVSVMIIPQALAYASLVGLPPIYGLYTSFVPLLVYMLFGTSRHLAVGPEAVLGVLIGAGIAEVMQDVTGKEIYTPEQQRELTIALAGVFAFLVGVLSLVLGLLRVGFVDNIFSRPLLRGFITALAFLIIIEQIDVMFGVVSQDLRGKHAWAKVFWVFEHTELISGNAIAVGFTSLAILLIFRYFKMWVATWSRFRIAVQVIRLIPEILVVVVLGLAFSHGLDLEQHGVPVLERFDTKFATPKFPSLTIRDITKLSFHALIVTLVGFIEAIVVVRNYATKHNYQVSANRELVAFGLQNIIGSCFGAWPSFAALSRTVVNEQANVKTQLSGGITASVVFVAIMLLLPAFQGLPKPVMGSIVVYAGYCLLEWHDVQFLLHIGAWKDLIILSGTAILTICLGAEVGILVCLSGSLFLIVKHSTFPTITIRGRVHDGTAKFQDLYVCTDINLFDDNHDWFHQANQFTKRGILVVRIEESLNFFNAGGLKALFWKVEQKSRYPLNAIVIDMRNVRDVDTTAAQTLLEVMTEYKQRRIEMCVVRLQDTAKPILFKSGIIDLVKPTNFYSKTSQAVAALETKMDSHSTYT